MDAALYSDVMDRALTGDQESLAALAEQVRARVYRYLFRVLLDEHKAGDLAQDTVLIVLKSLKQCQRIEHFWPWVLTIASNNLRQLYRQQATRRTYAMSATDDSDFQTRPDGQPESWSQAAMAELAEVTRTAIAQLSERHRMILVLRFYEGLGHAEIARVMGCSELAARVTLGRSKKALKRELGRRGITGAAILAALTGFGQLTESSEAATVGASSFDATILSKAFAAEFGGGSTAALAVPATVVVAIASVALWLAVTSLSPRQANTVAAYAPAETSANTTASTPLLVRQSSRGYGLTVTARPQPSEGRFYYPEGVGGPCLWTFYPTAPDMWAHRFVWITTPDATYGSSGNDSILRIRNRQNYCPMLHTQILPTDSAAFCTFVYEQEGEQSHAMVDKPGYTIERNPQSGCVTGGWDRRFKDKPDTRITFEYTTEVPPDLFNIPLPEGWTVQDERDEMHKRGWTFFRIAGRIGTETITGVGQIPFNYSASLSHPAWLRMQVGSRLSVSGTRAGGGVQDAAGQTQQTFGRGALLRGLSRPWEGLHTVDSIRRDGAEFRMPYVASRESDNNIQITVDWPADRATSNPGPVMKAVFDVSMGQDLLNSAQFYAGENSELAAELTFTYLDQVDEADPAFAPPAEMADSNTAPSNDAGVFWPVTLP